MMKSRFFALFAAALLSAPAFSTERPIIRDLFASSIKGTAINLSWELPESASPAITKLLVYRDIKPICSFYDLSEKTPLAELPPSSISYSDTAGDFKDYYYAVIADTSSGPYDIILPSINATVSGTHLKVPVLQKTGAASTASAKEKLYSPNGLRETPLPFLDLIESQNKKSLKMSDSTYMIARELGKDLEVRKNIISEPYIFEDDLVSPDGGDGFLLFEILRTTFIQKKYKEAEAALERLIGTNRTKDITNRATFYLAETYYFSADYKNAAKTFLKVYDVYPAAAKRWLDSTLDLYTIPQ